MLTHDLVAQWWAVTDCGGRYRQPNPRTTIVPRFYDELNQRPPTFGRQSRSRSDRPLLRLLRAPSPHVPHQVRNRKAGEMTFEDELIRRAEKLPHGGLS
jgi:hypothetical protein